MEKHIFTPDDFEFASHLQLAATRRMVVEVKLKKKPNAWKKIFVKKLELMEKGSFLLTRSDKTILLDSIQAISSPFGDLDTDAISCLCD